MNHFAGKRILVTGGAGYLARNLISLLEDTPCRILLMDFPDASYPSAAGAAEMVEMRGDVRTPTIWEQVPADVDIVFHFAAQTSTYLANEDPPSDLTCNVLPMLYLLEGCRKRGLRPDIIFASTVTIYGTPSRLPVDETHPENPQTVYDLHKSMAEQYLKYFIRQGNVRGAILRLSNVYGPGPKSSRPDRGILNLMIRKAMCGAPLTVYKPGGQIRDYVYVRDVAEAFLAAARNVETVNGCHFVIGSGRGYSITDAMNLVADRVALRTGKRVDVEHIDPPSPQSPIEYRNFVADARRFTEATGWLPNYQLPEGVDRTVEAFL
jgi:nucleoside-diphosphate-sugar epimerase